MCLLNVCGACRFCAILCEMFIANMVLIFRRKKWAENIAIHVCFVCRFNFLILPDRCCLTQNAYRMRRNLAKVNSPEREKRMRAGKLNIMKGSKWCSVYMSGGDNNRCEHFRICLENWIKMPMRSTIHQAQNSHFPRWQFGCLWNCSDRNFTLIYLHRDAVFPCAQVRNAIELIVFN